MKNIIFKTTILVFVWTFAAFGQEANSNVQQSKGKYLGLSKALRDLPQIHDEASMIYYNDEAKVRKNRVRPTYVDSTALPVKYDPLVKGSTMAKKSNVGVNIIQNFEGMRGAFPPDPSGAVSDDYYVQVVNTAYQVFNLDGTTATGKIQLNNLWVGSINSGDPIVMFDRHAERFVVTQFQTGSNEILLAISETSDPTGAYHTYSFSFDDFPDYPKFSVWSDGYYMTSNTGSKGVVAFERDKMLVGDPTASMIAMDLPVLYSDYGFKSVLPADADGDLPPYGTPISLFLFQDDSWSVAITNDHIKILKMSVDWTDAGNSSITIDQEINTSPFNAVFTSSWNDIEQKGSTQRIDAIASVFNYRAQYLKWPTYNTVLLCNVVDINNSLTAGIRWYELRQNTDNMDWEIHQEGTYSINDGNSRFLGSMAMDYNGNIGMGYSVSGPTEYPSLAATGRFSTDPLGEFTFSETYAVKGDRFQTGGNRFGDYSHMSLSPNGQEFWYTGEYIGSGGSRKTRVFSFNLQAQLDVQSEGINDEPTLVLMQDDQYIIVKGNQLTDSKEMYVDLFDVNGKQISRKTQSVLNQELNAKFDKSGLANGVYLVRIGQENFMRTEKIVIHK